MNHHAGEPENVNQTFDYRNDSLRVFEDAVNDFEEFELNCENTGAYSHTLTYRDPDTGNKEKVRLKPSIGTRTTGRHRIRMEGEDNQEVISGSPEGLADRIYKSFVGEYPDKISVRVEDTFELQDGTEIGKIGPLYFFSEDERPISPGFKSIEVFDEGLYEVSYDWTTRKARLAERGREVTKEINGLLRPQDLHQNSERIKHLITGMNPETLSSDSNDQSRVSRDLVNSGAGVFTFAKIRSLLGR